jgi:hypothetical protein
MFPSEFDENQSWWIANSLFSEMFANFTGNRYFNAMSLNSFRLSLSRSCLDEVIFRFVPTKGMQIHEMQLASWPWYEILGLNHPSLSIYCHDMHRIWKSMLLLHSMIFLAGMEMDDMYVSAFLRGRMNSIRRFSQQSVQDFLKVFRIEPFNVIRVLQSQRKTWRTMNPETTGKHREHEACSTNIWNIWCPYLHANFVDFTRYIDWERNENFAQRQNNTRSELSNREHWFPTKLQSSNTNRCLWCPVQNRIRINTQWSQIWSPMILWYSNVNGRQERQWRRAAAW